MKAYYAHCLAIYDTPQEKRDIATIERLGLTVVNPNSVECDAGYERDGMKYFDRFAEECDVVIFRAIPDGGIPAGIAAEIASFQKRGKPVIELPSGILGRVMSVDETREYLREIGHR